MFDEQSLHVPLVALAAALYEAIAMYFYTFWQSKSHRPLLNGVLGMGYAGIFLIMAPMYVMFHTLRYNGYLPESFKGVETARILLVSLFTPVFLMMPRHWKLAKRR